MKLEIQDISPEVYGKYTCCTEWRGHWWSDMDFDHYGNPKNGSISSPTEGQRVKKTFFGLQSWQKRGML